MSKHKIEKEDIIFDEAIKNVALLKKEIKMIDIELQKFAEKYHITVIDKT